MSNPNQTPYTIAPESRVRLPIALLFALVASAASAAFAVAMHRSEVADHTRTLANHEQRLERVEASQADLAVIRNDVRWIREQLAQRNR